MTTTATLTVEITGHFVQYVLGVRVTVGVIVGNGGFLGTLPDGTTVLGGTIEALGANAATMIKLLTEAAVAEATALTKQGALVTN